MRKILITVIVSAAGSPIFSNDALADVEWTIAPYLWASNVGLDVTVNDDPLVGADVPFNSLVDKVDFAFMGHFEGHGKKFGVYFDAIYLDLSDSSTTNIGPGGPISGDVNVDVGLTMSLLEIAGLYRFGEAQTGKVEVDLIAGVRQVDIEMPLSIALPPMNAAPLQVAVKISEVDFILGGRVLGRISDRWSYNFRADYGVGGTEGTINAHAMIGYSFGQSGLFSLNVGYRYMDIEFRDVDVQTVTTTELTLSGPIMGFIFNF